VAFVQYVTRHGAPAGPIPQGLQSRSAGKNKEIEKPQGLSGEPCATLVAAHISAEGQPFVGPACGFRSVRFSSWRASGLYSARIAIQVRGKKQKIESRRAERRALRYTCFAVLSVAAAVA
jgi:hypothetical protein